MARAPLLLVLLLAVAASCARQDEIVPMTYSPVDDAGGGDAAAIADAGTK